MKKGFDKEGFMRFLEQSFSGFENSFFRGTVENLIDYALEHCNHSLDQACYFLSDMLPEVDFSEVTAFMDDSMLTAHGREVKWEALAAMHEPFAKEQRGLSSLDDLISDAELAQIDQVMSDNLAFIQQEKGPAYFDDGR